MSPLPTNHSAGDSGHIDEHNALNTFYDNHPSSTDHDAHNDGRYQAKDSDLAALAALDSSTAGTVASDGGGWIKKSYSQFKTALGLAKADVGLGNVDNTADANKPVSSAVQTALDAKLSTTTASGTYVAQTDSSLDTARAKRDVALRNWNNQLVNVATPRLLIEGHSYVAGTGASVTSKRFASILAGRVTRQNLSVSTTIDGHAGQTSTQILANGAPSILNAATPVGCVVLMVMANDYANGVASATTKSNLQGIVAAYKTANGSPYPSFVIVIEPQRDDAISPIEAWANYVQAAKDVADADDYVTVLDLGTRMGNPATDTLSLFAVDRVHPKDAGHHLIGDIIADELMSQESRQGFAETFLIPVGIVPPLTATNWVTRSSNAGGTSFGNWNIESDGTQNAEITFPWIGRAGSWQINLVHRKGSNRGQYAAYIDGVALSGGAQVRDGYNSTPVDAVETLGGGSTVFQVPTSGPHTLRFVMATKNASSSSYVGSMSAIAMTRTGDLT